MPDSFSARIKLIDDAIALKETKEIPIALMISGLPYFFSKDGTTFKDSMYNYPKALSALVEFYTEFMPDAWSGGGMMSGKANELAGSTMIDWPGKPGTRVPDLSTYQVVEYEYMTQDEYPELLTDFTGFMLRKYIPRAYPNLKGLSSIDFMPSIILGTSVLKGLYSSSALEAYSILGKIGKQDNEAFSFSQEFGSSMTKLGIPPFRTATGEVPFDILSDYFRGTTGALMDQMECPEAIEKACDLFADIQILRFQYLKHEALPVKRVFFPMHKGMDGFMSPEQYEKLYWKPFMKVINALIDIDVTPILYTEGRYFTRIEQLAEVPKGKTIIHFENTDMVKAKKVLGDIACISGNFPIYLLEWGTKQNVIDEVKRLLDICAAGGGYIFDTDAFLENAKRENFEAMIETVRNYR